MAIKFQRINIYRVLLIFFLIIASVFVLDKTLFTPDLYAAELDLSSGQLIKLGEIEGAVTNIANWLMRVGVVVAVIFISWGSIRWMAAGNEPKRVDGARSTIKNGIIGLIILSGIGVILRTVESLINGTFFS